MKEYASYIKGSAGKWNQVTSLCSPNKKTLQLQENGFRTLTTDFFKHQNDHKLSYSKIFIEQMQ